MQRRVYRGAAIGALRLRKTGKERSPRDKGEIGSEQDMMHDMMGTSGMWGMGLIGLLLVAVLVLAAAALVKYLFSGR
jgi:hypothetical protein